MVKTKSSDVFIANSTTIFLAITKKNNVDMFLTEKYTNFQGHSVELVAVVFSEAEMNILLKT